MKSAMGNGLTLYTSVYHCERMIDVVRVTMHVETHHGECHALAVGHARRGLVSQHRFSNLQGTKT